MSLVKASDVFGYLKLSPKFNVSHRPFPLVEKDLEEGILVGLAENLNELFNEHVIAHGPIGRKLAKWADETVAALIVIKKAPVVKEEVPVAPVVEAPVVKEEAPAVEEVQVVEEAPVETSVVEEVPTEEKEPEPAKPVKKPRIKK